MMHRDYLKGTLVEDKIVLPLRTQFFECCQLNEYYQHSYPFSYPTIGYYQDDVNRETMIELGGLLDSEDALRVHFKTFASGQRQITTTVSHRNLKVHCRRVGQDNPDDLLNYGPDATWVKINGRIVFFIKEGTQVKPVENPTVVQQIRQSTESLLQQVEAALKL